MASKRLSILNLIIRVGGRIRIVSIDNGRRNNCYGVERRPDGSEKVWQLARGHWRDKKGDDTRMRSSRIRIEHLAEQIKILQTQLHRIESDVMSKGFKHLPPLTPPPPSSRSLRPQTPGSLRSRASLIPLLSGLSERHTNRGTQDCIISGRILECTPCAGEFST
jgi:hypothetical protein